ncbi:hypothetical protein BS50DRAFT_633394 [Corynespora cassiicola Philippines]|uniref:Uncharacterized protein n=1 Tax=Corynespora cassiicola Philippines TaxID=1448308 RepID=A0A2T2NQN5_CORCC|nr:hypothetical protein BS50DRAFT_633394 [Corynespora cassiicola Philippines]
MIWGSWIQTFGEDCLNKSCRHIRPTYWIVECFIGGMKTRRICWVNRHQDGPICTNQYYGEGPFKGKHRECGNIYGTMPIFAYDPDSDGMLMCIWPTTKALETRKSDPFNDTDGDASHIENYHPIYTMSDYPTLSIEASEKPVPFKNMKLDLKYITHPLGTQSHPKQDSEEDIQEAIEEELSQVTRGTQEMALTATAAASASGASRKRQASAEPPQLPEGKRM